MCKVEVGTPTNLNTAGNIKCSTIKIKDPCGYKINKTFKIQKYFSLVITTRN